MDNFKQFKAFLSGIYRCSPDDFTLTDKIAIMYFLWLICRKLGVNEVINGSYR
jgi:hypothetical protein